MVNDSFNVFVYYRGFALRRVASHHATEAEARAKVGEFLMKRDRTDGEPRVTGVEVTRVASERLFLSQQRDGQWVNLDAGSAAVPLRLPDRIYRSGETWFVVMIHSPGGWDQELVDDEESAQYLAQCLIESGEAEMMRQNGKSHRDIKFLAPVEMDTVTIIRMSTTTVARWQRHLGRGLVRVNGTPSTGWHGGLGAA